MASRVARSGSPACARPSASAVSAVPGASCRATVIPSSPETAEALGRAQAGLAERATRLGIDDVRIRREGDQLIVTVPSGTEEQVDALIAPGQLAVYSQRAVRDAAGTTSKAEAEASARPGDHLVVMEEALRSGTTARPVFLVFEGRPALTTADVAEAGVVDGAVFIGLTPAGRTAFEALTRQAAQDGAVRDRDQWIALVLDDRLLSNPTIDFQQYPSGIDGRNGLQLDTEPRDPAEVAAQLMTPLPPLQIAPAPGSG